MGATPVEVASIRHLDRLAQGITDEEISVANAAIERMELLAEGRLALVGSSAVAYPLGLGLAAGAMLFVVSHEVIPETHRNGHQTPATLGLMGGFALMMVLDTALG